MRGTPLLPLIRWPSVPGPLGHRRLLSSGSVTFAPSCACSKDITHRSGRDTVDHGRIGSDNFANSCCGVLRNLSNYLEYEYTYAAFQD